MAVGRFGKIYYAFSAHFRIKVYGPKGNYRKAFYYPYQNSTLKRKQFVNHLKNHSSNYRFNQKLKYIDFPKTWPALARMLLDDQHRLWVAAITDSPNKYRWYVLNTKNGNLLATFSWPNKRFYSHGRYYGIQTIKNGYVYAAVPNKKTRIKKLVKYRIIMEPNE